MKKNILLTTLLTAGIALTAHAQNVFIDLGDASTQTAGNWNNFTTAFSASTMPIVDLIDFDTNNDSGINAQITTDFFTINTGGQNAVIGDFDATAAQDSFYVTTASRPIGVITFTGLTEGQEYEINVLSSRSSDDNRKVLFTVTGSGFAAQTAIVNPSNLAASNIGTFASVVTDSAGTITLQFEGESGGSGTAFFSAIHLAAIPEPSTYAALLGFAVMGVALVRRRK